MIPALSCNNMLQYVLLNFGQLNYPLPGYLLLKRRQLWDYYCEAIYLDILPSYVILFITFNDFIKEIPPGRLQPFLYYILFYSFLFYTPPTFTNKANLKLQTDLIRFVGLCGRCQKRHEYDDLGLRSLFDSLPHIYSFQGFLKCQMSLGG